MGRVWRIGEVAERTGLTRRTLRHYDDLGLLVPSARSWGDYRLYDEADLLRLLQIQNLKALGLSLDEIARILADPALDAGATLRSHLAHLEEQIAAEQRLAARLRSLASAAQRSWDDVLDAIAATQQLVHPDPSVRMRAALAAPEAGPEELLAAAAAEPVVGVRDAVVLALSQQSGIATWALARLDDPDPARREVLVRLLGKLREPMSLPALTGLLDDPESRVVAAVVDALARLGDPAAAPALAALLGSDRIEPMDVTEALAGLGAEAVRPVAEHLRSGATAARAQAAEVLGRLGSAETAAALVAALADGDPSVRLAAVLALAELGEPGRPGLESVLGDPRFDGIASRLLGLS